MELQVFNENDSRPINLYFTSTRNIATQWTDEVRRSNKPYRVILTGEVRKKDKRFVVEVSRIDLLDGDGKVLKAFQ